MLVGAVHAQFAALAVRVAAVDAAGASFDGTVFWKGPDAVFEVIAFLAAVEEDTALFVR